MQPDVVIASHEHLQTLSALGYRFIAPDVDVLLFQRSPEAFNEYVVVVPTLAVHGEPCRASLSSEYAGELFWRVLAALIRIEHFRPAVRVDRFAHGLLAKVRWQRGRKPLVAFCRKKARHWLIWFGWTSNSEASSARALLLAGFEALFFNFWFLFLVEFSLCFFT